MLSPFQRHCSDESLICHLDGELPFYSRARVRRHLERCWPCRLRLNEIESQVLLTTRALEADAFPGPEQTAEARIRFLEQADWIAEEVFRRQRSSIPSRRVRAVRSLAWAAAAVVLCVISLWTLTRRDTRSAAISAMARVDAAEMQAAQAPLRQRFRVVVTQIRPALSIRENRLDVWSEPVQGHFATSFEDTGGRVRHAVWQPAPERRYVYRASVSDKVVRVSRQQANENWDLLRDGITLEDLESGLLTWLENRSWRPVSFSKALASLASSDGARLTMQETSSGGRPAVRLSATKTAGGITVEFVLDVDRMSHIPRLQTIRYTSPKRALQLELYSEEPPAAMPASFEPPREPAPPDAIAAVSPSVKSPEPAGLPVANASLLEVEIYRSLHRVRACLGETIEVAAGPGGLFEVRGVVAAAERRDELRAALVSLGDARLSIDIKSAQEVLREIRPESVSAGEQPEGKVSAKTSRAPEWLSRVLGVRESEAGEFADSVISSGEAFMQEAQALRHLTERFAGRAEFEAPELRGLVAAMESDHLKDLARRIESSRRLLAPILQDSPSGTPAARPPVGGRHQELLRIFELSKGLNEQLRGMLLGQDATVPREIWAQQIARSFATLQAAIGGV